MYQEFFSHSHLLILPVIALSLFVAAFTAILYWVIVILRDSPVPEYMANLPLSDGRVVDEYPEESQPGRGRVSGGIEP